MGEPLVRKFSSLNFSPCLRCILQQIWFNRIDCITMIVNGGFETNLEHAYGWYLDPCTLAVDPFGTASGSIFSSPGAHSGSKVSFIFSPYILYVYPFFKQASGATVCTDHNNRNAIFAFIYILNRVCTAPFSCFDIAIPTGTGAFSM